MNTMPRPEHPRPDFERASWQNLNGEWQFAVDNARCGLEKGWHTSVVFPERILVPFCPESALSGIGRTDFMNAVWYRRLLRIDGALRGRRLLLHCGAVDYDARVWVNGQQVARHRGGYTPFSADITDAVDQGGENEVVVYAEDDIRSGVQPSGKQSHRLGSWGCYYTRTTGIWQTIWLEAVPETRVSALTVWPDAANARVTLEIGVEHPVAGVGLEVQVLAADRQVAVGRIGQAGAQNAVALDIPGARLWNPLDPFLYDLRVRLIRGDGPVDEVRSYVGLRDIRIEGDRVLINGRSVFQRLILDQGFWPQGIYTAPSDEELKADIERSIACGYNGARLHQKVFEPRTLYWADRLGYLVWGEFPDWGCSIRHHAQSRQNFLREWMEAVLRDRSHPSLITWMPLNEAHSSSERYDPEFFQELYSLTRRMDPSRPFIDASGYTHSATDIWDVHDYDQDTRAFNERYARFGESPSNETIFKNDPEHEPRYRGQPYIVSEYGGIWWNPGQRGGEAWGYGNRPASEREFLERYGRLAGTLLANPHVAGLCYTQLTDVEQEVNGLYTYERKPKFPPEILRAVLQRAAAIEA